MRKFKRTIITTLSAFSLLLMALLTLSLPVTGQRPTPKINGHSLPSGHSGMTASSKGLLTGPNDGEALEIALRYLDENKDSLELTDADLADLIVTDQYVSQHNGVTHIYLRQRFNEIEVFGGNININIASDGRVINLGNHFVRCDVLSSPPNTPNTNQGCVAADSTARQPSLSAIEAVESAAQHLGLSVNHSLTVQRRSPGAAQQVLLSDGGISQDPIPVKLVYQSVDKEGLRLAWDMVINLENDQNWWNLRVDAVTGEVLSQNDWVVNDRWELKGHREGVTRQEEASEQVEANPRPRVALSKQTRVTASGQYRVFPFPYASPEDLGVSHALVTDSADPIASPFGWHDTDGVAGAEFTDTRGNNVFAQDDVDGNDKQGFRPDGGADLRFDFAIDSAFQPSGSTNLEAAIVNLFYWNNINHDLFYHYGFDEVSGNFQQNNYGKAGIEEDPLQADVQDRSGNNNANFGTPPDGKKPRMQMFTWTFTNPNRDSAFENTITVHEYGHGISNRLTGGPSEASCLFNSEQMGEGWSDWLALVVTAKATDMPTDPRGVGAYVLGQLPDGSGIRTYPYSTDMSINPQSYDTIKGATSPHQVGEVWGGMLWEMYWNLVHEHGFNPDIYANWNTGGNNLALQLVMDGMKLQPCEPGFVDGRDAILSADMVLTGGANQCLIWDAFAKRGLGVSANQGGSDSTTDGSQAFDIPLECLLLDATSPSQEICVGDTATYQVRVGPAYTPPIHISASATPLGTSLSLSPNPILTTPTTATLSIDTSERATVGNYTVAITGTDNSTSSNITVDLTLFNAAPGTVTLKEPFDRAEDVSRNPTFAWTAATQGASYIIEVDDNSDFSSIDYTAQVSDTMHIATSSLSPSRTYYWRVRGANSCDTGHNSTPFSFTTKAIFPILVVDDDHNKPDVRRYYTDILEALGLSYDLWETKNSVDEPDASFLAPYDMVIWFNGDSFGRLPESNKDREAALAQYLDRGKCLFLSSQTYHHDSGLTPFMQRYLGVESMSEDIWHTMVTSNGSLFGTLGSYSLNYPSGNYSDLVLPNDSAEVAFSSDKGGAAINSGVYRTVFFAFPFEAIATNKERQEVMQRIIEWCGFEVQIGTLKGAVIDESSGKGVEGARVTADNGRLQRVTTTDRTGAYTITLGVDSYNVTASGTNYISHTVTAVSVVSDSATNQDLALLGSNLSNTPFSMQQFMEIGEVITNHVTLTNRGPLPIDYEVMIEVIPRKHVRAFLPLILVAGSTQEEPSLRQAVPEPVEASLPAEGQGTASGANQILVENRRDVEPQLSRDTSPLIPAAPPSDEGAPDDFGYTYIDSQTPDGPRYNFIDISLSGTALTLENDESDGPFPIGFDFDFYGTSQSEFYISSNGFITFDNELASPPNNQCLLPHTREPNNLIALMWDDLDPTYSDDKIYYQNFRVCPYGGGECLIVQYKNSQHFPSGTARAGTFEAILFENGDILMQYKDVGDKRGSGSTTGIENADGTIGQTYGTCDTKDHIADKLAVCFAHPNGDGCSSGVDTWPSVKPNSGTIPPNSSTTLDLVFDATSHIQTGQFIAELSLFGNFVNDPDTIPLTMNLSCPSCGLLNGSITDAKRDKPLFADINLSRSDEFDRTISGDSYNLALEPGFYHFTVSAKGYLSQTTTITVTEDVTVTRDLALIPAEAKLDFSPAFITKSLSIGDVITHTMTITNFGVANLTFNANIGNIERVVEAKPPLADIRGQGEWLYREQKGVTLKANNSFITGDQRSSSVVYPSAYRWQSASANTLKILLYADDPIHKEPNTLPDQALKARGLSYTAYYNDWDGFEESLTDETWDLVLVANDLGLPPSSTLTALNKYVTDGGKLLLHGWMVRSFPGNPLWQTLGFTWKSDNPDPEPLYWWRTEHPVFTHPESLPEFTDFEDVDLRIYGQRVEPLPGALSLGGYTPDPNANEAALILSNDARTVFKSFLDAPNDADLDEDGILDGVELWMNLIVGIQTGFDASAQWPRIIPDSATIAPNSSATFDLVFDASSLYQVGDYRAQLGFSGNFVNDPGTIPLSMDVTCPTCGLLNGSITAGNTANPLPANIQVTGPNDFDVTITGDSYNLTLLPGRYELSVESSGYFTKTASVKITGGMTTTTDFDLLAKIILLPLVSKE